MKKAVSPVYVDGTHLDINFDKQATTDHKHCSCMGDSLSPSFVGDDYFCDWTTTQLILMLPSLYS